MLQTKSRIKPIDAELNDPLKSEMEKIFPLPVASPILYRTVAKNESLFIDLIRMKLLGPRGLLDRGQIKSRLRELTILRTCVASKNWYEFNLHITTISEMMGLSKTQIEDIRSDKPDPSLWEPSDIALMKLIDSLVARIEVDDDLFNSVSKYFNESDLIELVMLTGLYVSVAMIVALARPEFDQYENKIA